MYEFDKFDEISDNLKQYLNTNYELIKLETTERISTVGASFVGGLVVGITVFLFVFTLSIGLGFYLSALLNNTFAGFLIIAAFYFVLALVILVVRKKLIETPLRDTIICKLLEKKDN